MQDEGVPPNKERSFFEQIKLECGPLIHHSANIGVLLLSVLVFNLVIQILRHLSPTHEAAWRNLEWLDVGAAKILMYLFLGHTFLILFLRLSWSIKEEFSKTWFTTLRKRKPKSEETISATNPQSLSSTRKTT